MAPPTKPRSSIDSQSPHPSPRPSLAISDEQHKGWNADQGRRGGEGYPDGFLPHTEEEKHQADNEAPLPPSHAVPEYQVYAFTDLVAFRFLEEEKGVDVVDRRQQLEGYEAYLVEQWACSRDHPTFVITAFTGDPNHKITVGLLRVPKDRTHWSPALKTYFDALSRYHVREKESPLGTLLVTNLSSFPSALNVIHIPDGDVRRHREVFTVNENLKRMGCSGRSALALSPPSDGSQSKFRQIYSTNDRIPFNTSVVELVHLCQLALCLFGRLSFDYTDGLLCDVTERAINDWWTEIGPDYFDIEPSDGILGPTTVAALLGVLVGARIRLNSVGSPVPKDAFDVEAMKRGIAHFQKHQKLRRSRRLDRETLERLRKVTSKSTTGDRFKVNALKSTMADLSGKQRSNAEESETCEFDKFLHNLHGDRLKYLWRGKSRKHMPPLTATFELNSERSSSKRDIVASPTAASSPQLGSAHDSLAVQNVEGNNHSAVTLASSITSPAHSRTDSMGKTSAADPGSARTSQEITSPGSVASREHRDRLRKSMFRTMANKNLDSARSTLGGKIKDVAGTMGLSSKKQHSRDQEDGHAHHKDRRHGKKLIKKTHSDEKSDDQLSPIKSRTEPLSKHRSAPSGQPRSMTELDGMGGSFRPSFPQSTNKVDGTNTSSPTGSTFNMPYAESPTAVAPSKGFFESNFSFQSKGSSDHESSRSRQNSRHRPSEIAPNFIYDPNQSDYADEDGNENENLQAILEPEIDPFMLALRRRHSASRLVEKNYHKRNEEWWPRRMSFSHVQEVFLEWEPIIDEMEHPDSKLLRMMIPEVTGNVKGWTEEGLGQVYNLYENLEDKLEQMSAQYRRQAQDQNTAKSKFADAMDRERAMLDNTLKDVEILGAKLQYEINSLTAKVSDFQDTVATFGNQVLELEDKWREWETLQRKPRSLFSWFMSHVLGVGEMPYDWEP